MQAPIGLPLDSTQCLWAQKIFLLETSPHGSAKKTSQTLPSSTSDFLEKVKTSKTKKEKRKAYLWPQLTPFSVLDLIRLGFVALKLKISTPLTSSSHNQEETDLRRCGEAGYHSKNEEKVGQTSHFQPILDASKPLFLGSLALFPRLFSAEKKFFYFFPSDRALSPSETVVCETKDHSFELFSNPFSQVRGCNVLAPLSPL